MSHVIRTLVGPGADAPCEITLAGRLYASAAPELETAVARASPTAPLLLDATDLEAIDAVALRVLLRAARARAAGGRIVVRGARPGVRRFLELVGFDRIVELAPSPNGAGPR
jgi:anti-anti-sigma factor